MALMRDILSKTAHKVSDREYFARAHKIGTRATNVTMKKKILKRKVFFGLTYVHLKNGDLSIRYLFKKR